MIVRNLILRGGLIASIATALAAPAYAADVAAGADEDFADYAGGP